MPTAATSWAGASMSRWRRTALPGPGDVHRVLRQLRHRHLRTDTPLRPWRTVHLEGLCGDAAGHRRADQHDADGRPSAQCTGRADEQHGEELLALQQRRTGLHHLWRLHRPLHPHVQHGKAAPGTRHEDALRDDDRPCRQPPAEV